MTQHASSGWVRVTVALGLLAGASGWAQGAAGPTAVLRFDDGTLAGFRQVTGLGSSVEIIEFRDPGDEVVRKRPGKDIRKSISVVLVGRRGGEARRYNLLERWPCRWQAPELNSTTDTHLVEEIEFAVEKVERK